MRLYLEKTHQKRAGGVAQSVGPEFNPQDHKTKQNKTKTKDVFVCLKLNSQIHVQCCLEVGTLGGN
jgi:hypothetical protein